MSTYYYRLQKPITSLRLEKGKGHDKLWVWVNNALSGKLILRNDETKSMISLFASGDSVLSTHWGGENNGTVVTVLETNLLEGEVVISEYGELLTVREVKRREGAKRQDGMPTELFGYEETRG